MSQITYETVVKMVEQLSPTDQESLVNHLQAIVKQRKLDKAEWKAMFEATILHVPVITDFSPRRED